MPPQLKTRKSDERDRLTGPVAAQRAMQVAVSIASKPS
jgi:hypothetical protein